jgi:hypothetical protein
MKQLPSCLAILMVLVLETLPGMAQGQPASPEVVIVMSLSVEQTASQETIRDRARELTAELRKQPGALDDMVLQNAARGSSAEYILLMRWRRREDWEAMLANTELWQTLNKSAHPFKLERTAMFRQLQ